MNYLFESEEEIQLYNKVKSDLREAYEKLSDDHPYMKEKTKASILIDHESAQLTRLILDMESSRSPIFVTADLRLMSLCKGAVLGKCTNSIISHLGFLQLVDLVLGLDTDRKTLSRLVWNIGYTNEENMIRNYLIDLALQNYDDALMRAMWEVIDEISRKTSAQINEDKIDIFSTNEKERARVAAFFDRVEEGFFANMAAIIRKREKDH